MKTLSFYQYEVRYEYDEGRYVLNGQAYPTAEALLRAFFNAPAFRHADGMGVMIDTSEQMDDIPFHVDPYELEFRPDDVPEDASGWGAEIYWRNEVFGDQYTVKRYCRKCQQAWEACWCVPTDAIQWDDKMKTLSFQQIKAEMPVVVDNCGTLLLADGSCAQAGKDVGINPEQMSSPGSLWGTREFYSLETYESIVLTVDYSE